MTKSGGITNIKNTAVMLALLAAASLLGFLFRYTGFQDVNIVLVYLLAVLFTSWLTQKLVFGILSSILATFLFYYFFVLPYFGFTVDDPNYWITFITMLVTALITGMLTSHAKESALKAQKREAEAENERYRANLLRSISHDLRTPLSGIMGASEMLIAMLDGDDAKVQLSRDIYRDADWLHSMVTNILSLTRLRDGQVNLDKNSEVVEEVIGGAIIHIAKRNPQYDINVDIPDEALILPMDARLIEQVFINLLDNAIKHTPENGEINIAVKRMDTTVEFTVSDSGCGIAQEDLPNLFQQFYTTHNEQDNSKQGAGLGLAICDTIIKAHGGRILARNRKDTPGAEFIFTLPMEDRQ